MLFQEFFIKMNLPIVLVNNNFSSQQTFEGRRDIKYLSQKLFLFERVRDFLDEINNQSVIDNVT